MRAVSNGPTLRYVRARWKLLLREASSAESFMALARSWLTGRPAMAAGDEARVGAPAVKKDRARLASADGAYGAGAAR